MMGLRTRRTEIPPDPLAPVMTRTITTARPVFEDAPLAGVWTGSGCHLAGVQRGGEAADETVEMLIQAAGGFDVLVTEPPALIKATAIRGGKRDERWFRTLMDHADQVIPGALADLWESEGIGVPMEHAKLLGAMYAHPISHCWPGVAYDVWHVHGLISGTVRCDCPDCDR